MGRWDTIKQKWLTNFFNNKNEPGLSINKKVTAQDEWCAEASLSTNYNLLTKKYFENTLLNYSSFLFSNKLTDLVSVKSLNNENFKLSIDHWKWFKLYKYLFEITGSPKIWRWSISLRNNSSNE